MAPCGVAARVAPALSSVSRLPFRLSQLSQMSQFRGYRFEITANCSATVAACRLSQSVTEPVSRYEAELFRTVDARRREMLCPVRWCPDGGWLMVMATAAPLTEVEKDRLIDTDSFPDWDYMPGEDSQPFEYKATDWD